MTQTKLEGNAMHWEQRIANQSGEEEENHALRIIPIDGG